MEYFSENFLKIPGIWAEPEHFSGGGGMIIVFSGGGGEGEAPTLNIRACLYVPDNASFCMWFSYVKKTFLKITFDLDRVTLIHVHCIFIQMLWITPANVNHKVDRPRARLWIRETRILIESPEKNLDRSKSEEFEIPDFALISFKKYKNLCR